MKKLLALILSAIMLLSIMPVAYAAPAEYPPEVEQYLDIWVKIRSYERSLFEDEDDFNTLMGLIKNAEAEFNSLGYEYDYRIEAPIYEGYKGYPEINFICDFNECFQPAIDEMEAKFASGEIKVVINFYGAYKYWYTFTSHYDLEEASKILEAKHFMNNQEYALMYYKADEYDIPLDGEQTQAEFDAGWKEYLVPFYDMLMDCLDGNHPYGEYISNNDATEQADGTKTATCEFCGATDTVVDEGSKLVKEEESLSFFAKLIAWIKALFEKIFSIFG